MSLADSLRGKQVRRLFRQLKIWLICPVVYHKVIYMSMWMLIAKKYGEVRFMSL